MAGRFRCATVLFALVCVTGCSRHADQDAGSEAKYVGSLEAAHDIQIHGWACDQKRPDEAIELTLLDGDSVLATVKADLARKDLEGKFGKGKHGFVLPTPKSLKDGQSHQIHVVVSGTKFELKNSPKTYQFPDKTQNAEKKAE